MVNRRTALMSSRVIPTREAAYDVECVFEDEKVVVVFNPDELFVTNEEITMVAFKATYSLSEIDELHIDPFNIQPEGSSIIALHAPVNDDPKWAFKWLDIRE
jgi:hypothetical protein